VKQIPCGNDGKKGKGEGRDDEADCVFLDDVRYGGGAERAGIEDRADAGEDSAYGLE
jgi:hypothetical protein